MIIMLAVYSVSIFFVDAWWALAVFAALFVIALVASRVPARQVFSVAGPIYLIAAFTLAFNAFQYQDGSMALSAYGLARGAFFAVRILLLVWMSLILCLMVAPTRMTHAFSSLLSPLRALRVPVDDVAAVFSVALRFIPLMAEEFFAVRDVQWSRGASFGEGSLVRRVRAYFVVFVPLFVGLFRRADKLALAMDARCYGLPGVTPTEMRSHRLDGASAAVTGAVVAICVAVAALG